MTFGGFIEAIQDKGGLRKKTGTGKGVDRSSRSLLLLPQLIEGHVSSFVCSSLAAQGDMVATAAC